MANRTLPSGSNLRCLYPHGSDRDYRQYCWRRPGILLHGILQDRYLVGDCSGGRCPVFKMNDPCFSKGAKIGQPIHLLLLLRKERHFYITIERKNFCLNNERSHCFH